MNDVERPAAERPAAERPVTPIVDDIAPWMAALAGAVRLGLAGLTRVRVEGAIDEIPRTGPVIVAANHSSNLDVPVLGSSLMPKLGRRLQWLGKRELFDWPVIGWIARNGGVHAVDRGAADVEAFRIATRILEDGHALFVFPEGTRSRDGTLGEGRDGVSVLALRTGAPIVPVGVSGSYERWPRGPEVSSTRRACHGPRRLPVPPRRRLARGPGPSRGQDPGDRPDHAAHRRAAPRASAWPVRRRSRRAWNIPKCQSAKERATSGSLWPIRAARASIGTPSVFQMTLDGPIPPVPAALGRRSEHVMFQRLTTGTPEGSQRASVR